MLLSSLKIKHKSPKGVPDKNLQNNSVLDYAGINLTQPLYFHGKLCALAGTGYINLYVHAGIFMNF